MFPLSDTFRRQRSASEDADSEEKDDVEDGDGEEVQGYVVPMAKLQVTADGQLEEKLLVRTEGWMYKKGGAVNQRLGRKNWKKRWFVLNKFDFRGQTGYELQYFDRPNGTLKGSVGLMDVVIFCEARTKHHKIKYEFQLNLPNGGILELSCDDDKEREEWIETLNMAIAFMRTLTHPVAMVLNGYDPLDEDDEDVFSMGEQIAQNCQAYGPGLYGAEAGKREQFVLQIYDVDGMQVTRGGMPVTCSIYNDEVMYYVKVLDNQDGTFSAFYMLGSPGKYKLSIRLNDEHEIHGSPFDIEILPSKTVATCSTAEGEALVSVFPDQLSSFTIVARDALGNAKTRGGDPFEVSIQGPAHLTSIDDNEDGTYTCAFEAQDPSKAQFYAANTLQINVTLYGKPIMYSPFRPIILDAPVMPAAMSSSGPSYAYAHAAEEEREAEERKRLMFGDDDDEEEDENDAVAQPENVPQVQRRHTRVPEGSDDRSGSSLDRVARARERARQKKQESAAADGTAAAPAAGGGAVAHARSASIASSGAVSLGSVNATSSVLSVADETALRQEFASGLTGAPPATAAATSDDRQTWALIHKALCSPPVVDLLARNLNTLKQAFDLVSETVDGYRVLKQPNATRLLQALLGVSPPQFSERDAQMVFSLMLQAQANGRVPAAAILGGQVLDFAHYVKFLLGLVLYTLTKNAALNAEHGSIEVSFLAPLSPLARLICSCVLSLSSLSSIRSPFP